MWLSGHIFLLKGPYAMFLNFLCNHIIFVITLAPSIHYARILIDSEGIVGSIGIDLFLGDTFSLVLLNLVTSVYDLSYNKQALCCFLSIFIF